MQSSAQFGCKKTEISLKLKKFMPVYRTIIGSDTLCMIYHENISTCIEIHTGMAVISFIFYRITANDFIKLHQSINRLINHGFILSTVSLPSTVRFFIICGYTVFVYYLAITGISATPTFLLNSSCCFSEMAK